MNADTDRRELTRIEDDAYLIGDSTRKAELVIVDMFVEGGIAGNDDRHVASRPSLEDRRRTSMADHDSGARQRTREIIGMHPVLHLAASGMDARDAALHDHRLIADEIGSRAHETVEWLLVGSDGDQDHWIGPSNTASG